VQNKGAKQRPTSSFIHYGDLYSTFKITTQKRSRSLHG